MSGLADAPAPDFATELVQRAADGGAHAAQVTAVDVDRFEIDFSERKVDLLRSTANETTTILVLRGGKRGSAILNGRNEEAVEAALHSALMAAEAGLADPANAVADAPFAGSLFGAGKAVLRPVAWDQVRGARGRGQGTETVAKLGGLPPSVACVSQRLEA